MKTKRAPHSSPRTSEEPPKESVSSVEEKDIWPEPRERDVLFFGL